MQTQTEQRRMTHARRAREAPCTYAHGDSGISVWFEGPARVHAMHMDEYVPGRVPPYFCSTAHARMARTGRKEAMPCEGK